MRVFVKRGLAGVFGLPAAAGMVLLGIAAAAPVAQAQEEEECDCREPRSDLRRLWQLQFSSLRQGPMLGVSLDMALDADVESVGVRVADVMEGGPAEGAGVKTGDIIVSLDGHALTEPLEDALERELDEDASFPGQRLTRLVRELEEGEPVELVVRRDGEEHVLSVTPEDLDGTGWWSTDWRPWGPEYEVRLRDLGERLREQAERSRAYQQRLRMPEVPRDEFSLEFSLPDDSVLRSWRGQVPQFLAMGFGRFRGLELVELNPGLGAYFGTETGVLVADVDDDSQLGLQPGDVVTAIDGRDVDDMEEFWRILRSYRAGEEFEFSIWRDGAETIVIATIE